MKRFFFKSMFILLSGMVCSGTLLAQTFTGATIDKRAGIHSLVLNPALAADSKMRMDINIVSASAFIGNDYLSVNLSDLDSFRNGYELDPDANSNSSEHNNFFGNADVLGPSVLFNFDEKNTFAITTRVRTFFNITNIGGDLYELANTNDDISNFTLQMEDTHGLVHAWGEIGASYARVIIDDERQSLKAGVTLKYLAGAGGMYGSSNVLNAEYNSESNLLTTSGALRYGVTSGFESEDINFSDIKSGFGADIGVVYEFKEQNVNTSLNPYKLKVGVSLMDIGAINYNRTIRTLYNMDNTIDASEFAFKDIDEVLEDNYPGIEIDGKTKMGLPTSLQFFADYNINGKFFVSAQGGISMKQFKDNPVSNYINTFTLTPRFERRWLSVYSPLSVRKYDSSLAWGVGVRAGPVTIGSGSIFTNLISKTSRSADVYIGFRVPLYR